MEPFYSGSPGGRFVVKSPWAEFGGPEVFTVVDTDQRCCVDVSVPGEDNEEDFVRSVITRYIDELEPNVTLINVSADARAIPRAKLIEVERLAPDCDLVCYAGSRSGLRKKTVFKYQWNGRWGGTAWDELNCWIRVTGHPNIVPIDRIVTEHSELPGLGHKEVVVGFTSKFVGGGNLKFHRNRLFKLKHLKQLLRVIDDLNLRYGIAHQDVNPHNMLIDPASDCLQIFDFDCAARIGQGRLENSHPENYFGNSNYETNYDVKGVAFSLYEVITGDHKHSGWIYKPDSKISDVLDEEWVQDCQLRLDCDLLEYRKALCEWIRWRERPENMISHYTEAPEYIDWPMPFVPVMPCQYGDNEPVMEPIIF